ncbi:RNA polymerase sigma factor [Actinosynnema sp. ALI-1.44]|uniref:RNA polymerase sigma factor n=1 Tax=Actinosynnema sp. ALI-1.44 TaxID=1933779 RepID=UPI0022A99182|nr:sigma-70 family RNA polymerase sigma factor [Actinosynnema sp. ALI-1.44]
MRSDSASAADGPESRFEEFYTRCFPSVSRTLAVLTGDTRTADDCAQEAFLLAKHRWNELATYDKPEAWVVKVALRKLRRDQRPREQPLDVSDLDTIRTRINDHAEDIVLRDELYAAVRSLPQRRAEVVALHDLGGHSISEVASILHIADSTVRSHLTHAHQHLHRLLSTSDVATQGESHEPE